jgi:hypothetical protein
MHQIEHRFGDQSCFLPTDPPYHVTITGAAGWDSGVHCWKFIVRGCKSNKLFIGISTEHSASAKPVGGDECGWGINLSNGERTHQGRKITTGNFKGLSRAREGQSFVCTLDCNNGTFSVRLDGRNLGVAFTDLPKGVRLYPAVSLKQYADCFVFGGEDPPDPTVAVSKLVTSVRRANGLVTAMLRQKQVSFQSLEAIFSAYQLFRKRTIRNVDLGLAGMIRVETCPRVCATFGFLEGTVVRTKDNKRARVLGADGACDFLTDTDAKVVQKLWVWEDGKTAPELADVTELRAWSEHHEKEEASSKEKEVTVRSTPPSEEAMETKTTGNPAELARLSDFVRLIGCQATWTLDADSQLVSLANQIATEKMCHPAELLASDLCRAHSTFTAMSADTHSESEELIKLLKSISSERLLGRFCLCYN